MNEQTETSPLLLLGIGGAGAAMTAGITRAYGKHLRTLVIDTDASSGGQPDMQFVLLGGNRLAGRGAGGDIVAGRLAAEDSLHELDGHFTGVRVAVIVTALGGGTGGGATVAVIKHLREIGVPTLVFATTPFPFEGESRVKHANSVISLLERYADSLVVIPLADLVNDGGSDNMNEALSRGVDTLATGVTLLWRVLENPGYIRLDVERLRRLILCGGRARFAIATATGNDRADVAVSALKASKLLSANKDTPRTRAILTGVLAGNDLRLSEVGRVADNIVFAFGPDASLALGTVNDEATFSGRLTVVTMLFEEGSKPAQDGVEAITGHRQKTSALSFGPKGRGRFAKAEQTLWNGEDLDIPTFLRHKITLDR